MLILIKILNGKNVMRTSEGTGPRQVAHVGCGVGTGVRKAQALSICFCFIFFHRAMGAKNFLYSKRNSTSIVINDSPSWAQGQLPNPE